MFRSNSLFVGGNSRKAIQEGRADAIPIFLCEIPRLFRQKILNLDVVLVSVSPPDKHGFCSLGTSVDCTRSAIQNAKYIIGKNLLVLEYSKIQAIPSLAHLYKCTGRAIARLTMVVASSLQHTVKILKFGTPQTIAIIVLKIEKFDVTLH